MACSSLLLPHAPCRRGWNPVGSSKLEAATCSDQVNNAASSRQGRMLHSEMFRCVKQEVLQSGSGRLSINRKFGIMDIKTSPGNSLIQE